LSRRPRPEKETRRRRRQRQQQRHLYTQVAPALISTRIQRSRTHHLSF
jgi:hypothetical protein